MEKKIIGTLKLYELTKMIPEFAKSRNKKITKKWLYGDFDDIKSAKKSFDIHHFAASLLEDIIVAVCDERAVGSKDQILKTMKKLQSLENKEIILVVPYITKVNITNLNNYNVFILLCSSFISNPLKHITAPINLKLVPENELDHIFCKKINLKHISHKDPMMIWAGFKKGDIISFEYTAPNCCMTVDYRYLS